jgi:hypothetical protein
MSVEAKNVVVFDFDGTLYAGDSLFDFCLFYYRKKPLRIWFVFLQCFGFLVFGRGTLFCICAGCLQGSCGMLSGRM